MVGSEHMSGWGDDQQDVGSWEGGTHFRLCGLVGQVVSRVLREVWRLLRIGSDKVGWVFGLWIL